MTGKVRDRKTIVPQIAERLATGEPLAVICRDLKISRRTVQLWRAEDVEIDAALQDARDDGYDAIAHRGRATARGDSVIGESTGDVQRDKLILHYDMQLLSKWDKKRYGESKAIDHSSTDGTMTPKGLSDFYAGIQQPAETGSANT